MSQRLQLAIKKQQSVQRARGTAWIVFLGLMPVIFFLLVGFGVSLENEGFSIGGTISGVIGIAMIWVAVQVFREARRLGALLRNPELLMRDGVDAGESGSVHWSVLNPFSGWRDD